MRGTQTKPATSATLAIQVRGLTKSYGDTAVLAGVDLDVAAGTVHALLGPNGAGKTTLVRILSTLLPADGGRAGVLGRDALCEPRQVRRLIGLTGQYAAVDDLLTGRENLVMIGQLLGLGPAGSRRRAGELLEQFGLSDAADRRAATYSGGMRRRLDLAASLIGDPPVLFLDEPTTGLDPRSRRGLWDVVEALAGDGVTILLTTQYLEEADQLADRISVLDHGTIVTEGTARELKQRVGQERLTLHMNTAADVDRARTVLRAEEAHVTESGADAPFAITMPLNGPDHLRRVLDALAAADVVVTDVALHSPTLDDVFFAVTGGHALETVR
jgi:ABC-2 type transport system ATP-binding protein